MKHRAYPKYVGPDGSGFRARPPIEGQETTTKGFMTIEEAHQFVLTVLPMTRKEFDAFKAGYLVKVEQAVKNKKTRNILTKIKNGSSCNISGMIKEPHQFYENSNIPKRRGVGLWDGKWRATRPKGAGTAPNVNKLIKTYPYLEQAEVCAETFERVWGAGTDPSAADEAAKAAAEKVEGITLVPTVTTPVIPKTVPLSNNGHKDIDMEFGEWSLDSRPVIVDFLNKHTENAFRVYRAAIITEAEKQGINEIELETIAYHLSQYLAEKVGQWKIVLNRGT